MKFKRLSERPLKKKARRGFRGYPIGTITYYGPDDRRASKVVASIVETEDAEPAFMEKWFSLADDVRDDREIDAAILRFFNEHSVKSVVMTQGLIGCPHEEGTDYPEGQVCPQCPYWAGRDRWSGELKR